MLEAKENVGAPAMATAAFTFALSRGSLCSSALPR
jgi:hypothetical protein